jgi:hypothetical protein
MPCPCHLPQCQAQHLTHRRASADRELCCWPAHRLKATARESPSPGCIRDEFCTICSLANGSRKGKTVFCPEQEFSENWFSLIVSACKVTERPLNPLMGCSFLYFLLKSFFIVDEDIAYIYIYEIFIWSIVFFPLPCSIPGKLKKCIDLCFIKYNLILRLG